MKLIILSVLTLVLTGCASQSYSPIGTPDPSKAIVHVVRERAEPTAWNMYVDVDGQRVGSLADSSTVAFTATAGERKFLFSWPILAGSVKLEAPITLNAGSTYYFVVSGRLNNRVTGGYGVTIHSTHSLDLFQVPDDVGRQLVLKYER